MAKSRYTSSRDGRPIRQIETERATFREAYSTSGALRRERCLVLSLKKHVGRVSTDLDLSMSHREALRMLTAAATCLMFEGTPRSAEAGRALLDSLQNDNSGTRADRSPRRGVIPSKERLLDDLAFRQPERTVGDLEPVEALRLLEEAEPQLAGYVERRMAAVLGPLQVSNVDAAVVDQLHREVVAMVVTSLLTLRQAYRDLYAEILPDPSQD